MYIVIKCNIKTIDVPKGTDATLGNVPNGTKVGAR